MKTIGEGTFGKVKLGTHILTGERVAVKVLEKERIVEIADVERVAREIHILKLIRHAHIIQLYEIIETPRQLYLIMEYASGGELFDYIVQHSRAEEPEACRFLHQILAGVEEVHSMRVVHRDLKPENLLLDERKDIKIVDFGLSNTYKENQLLQTACGSPCYAAPEMIAGHRYVPPMVDIWSCGVILFALVCGYLPFEDQNHAELYKKILNAEYEIPSFISAEVADLISGMLTIDPTRRMTLDDIRKHIWYCQIPEASISGGIVSDPKAAPVACRQLDEEILEQLDSYGFDRQYVVKCLRTNKHNHVTTTYYLLKEKRRRQGAKPTNTDIADLDATGFEDVEPPASMAAAVAAVATPSRSGVHEVDRSQNGRSAPPRPAQAWLDSEGAMVMPDGRTAMQAIDFPQSSSTPVPGAMGRPIPKLNLNEMPRDEPQTTRPSSARSGTVPGVKAAAASVAAAAALAAATMGREGSCSRSPRQPPPYSSRGENHDPPTAWMPSPQRLAFEGPGTPRAPLSARAGSRGYSHEVPGGPPPRRHASHGATGRSSRPRRACSPWRTHGGYGHWREAEASQRVYGPEREATPRWPPHSEASSGPPLSARPRLQGNHGYRDRDRSSPSRRSASRSGSGYSGGRSVPVPGFGHPHAPPLSARGASSREGVGRGAEARQSSSSGRSSSVIHAACSNLKNPKQVIQEVLRALSAQRMNSKQVSSFLIRCQAQNNVRFEAEVCQMDRGGGYIVRFSRVSGDVWLFKELCGQLRAELRI